ncbi:MAG: response regulator [Phototrophicaceae bacterium]
MNKRFFIADDDPSTRMLLSTALRRHGYEVETAKSGTDALRLLRELGLPDVFLVDYNMPGLNGLEVIQEVRAHDPTHSVKIILATGTHMRSSDLVEPILSYADFMLAKPFDINKLLQVVEQLYNQP